MSMTAIVASPAVQPLVSPQSIAHVAQKKANKIVESGLARVSSKLVKKYSRRFIENPLDLKISYIEDNLLEMIRDSQEKLSELKKKAEEAEKSCWLSKRTSRILMVSFTVAAIATISSLIANTILMPEQPTAQASMALGGFAAIVVAAKEYAKELKDDADDEAKLAREKQREVELQQAQMLCLFLKELKSFKKARKKPTQYSDCTQHFKNCLERLGSLPDFYKCNLPSKEKLMSSLITGFPDDHPVKKIVDSLFRIAQEGSPAHQHLQRTSSASIIEEVDDKQRSNAGKESDSKASAASALASMSPPRMAVRQLSSVEKEREYQQHWEEFEKTLGKPIDSLELYGYRLNKNGTLNGNPKRSPSEATRPSIGIAAQPVPSDVVLQIAPSAASEAARPSLNSANDSAQPKPSAPTQNAASALAPTPSRVEVVVIPTAAVASTGNNRTVAVSS